MRLKVASIATVLLVGTCALAAGVFGTRTPAVGSEQTCAAPDARIVVDLAQHALALCDRDKLVEAFVVRLGRGGIGKTREGDGRTPIGTYTLGVPRPSNRYGTFIPVGFPTEEQKKKGYTGSRRCGMWQFGVLGGILVAGGVVIGVYALGSLSLGGWVTAVVTIMFAFVGRHVASAEQRGQAV